MAKSGMPEMAPAMEAGGPRRIITELRREQLWRAAYNRRQLQDVMVQFWMNHFNVYAGKRELLNSLMEENRLNQRSFEPDVPQSCVSDFLNGIRPISNSQAVLFCRRIHVKPSIFLGLE